MFRNLSEQPNPTILLFLIFALLTACGSSRQIHPTMAAADSSLSRQDRIEIFEDVWKTVNEQYYDPSFHGANWQEVHDRYRPRIEAVKDDTGFYSLFEVMLAELRDAHTLLVIRVRLPITLFNRQAAWASRSAKLRARPSSWRWRRIQMPLVLV